MALVLMFNSNILLFCLLLIHFDLLFKDITINSSLYIKYLYSSKYKIFFVS